MTTEQQIKKWKARPMSWSQLSSFLLLPSLGCHYGSPEKWYKSYVLGERASSREMEFGSEVDVKIQKDPKFLPALPRYALMQHKMEAKYRNIKLVGLPDGFCIDDSDHEKTAIAFKVFLKDGFLLADYKTGKQPWDQTRADRTGQLTWYLLLAYKLYSIRPEQFECFIHCLPTEDASISSIGLVDCEPVTLRTKRTMSDVAALASIIVKTREEMEDYIRNHE